MTKTGLMLMNDVKCNFGRNVQRIEEAYGLTHYKLLQYKDVLNAYGIDSVSTHAWENLICNLFAVSLEWLTFYGLYPGDSPYDSERLLCLEEKVFQQNVKDILPIDYLDTKKRIKNYSEEARANLLTLTIMVLSNIEPFKKEQREKDIRQILESKKPIYRIYP